jgi:hypothetical protein
MIRLDGPGKADHPHRQEESSVAVPFRAAIVLRAVITESVGAYLQGRVEGGASALVGSWL